jgi:integrase
LALDIHPQMLRKTLISLVGKEAGVVVVKDDCRTGRRQKYVSAHDLRRGCAHRLINAGVSAETLKVVMRHCDFATTEKHYGAIRSAKQQQPNFTRDWRRLRLRRHFHLWGEIKQLPN